MSTIGRIAELLEVDPVTLAPERRGLLLLLRIGVDVAALLAGQEHDPDDLAGARTEQARLFDPTLDARFLNTLDRRIEPAPDGAWMGEEPEPGLSPAALYLAALGLLPPCRGISLELWNYLSQIGSWGVDPDLQQQFQGWLRGSADRECEEAVDGWLSLLASQDAVTAAIVDATQARRQLWQSELAGERYLELRRLLLERLPELERQLTAFHVDRSRLTTLLRHLDSDRLRLAVLGEFNRGKSTIINALVGEPDLMPTDILPATSALTELLYGEQRTYAVNRDGPLGSFEPADPDAFRSNVANAAAARPSSPEEAEAAAGTVPFWRVELPAAFLAETRVALIDTPGLGEDYARDSISRSEAHRADAALILFDATQQASLQELELLEQMRSKARDVFVAINKADTVAEDDWDRIRSHVVARIGTVTDAIPADQVMLVSAGRAEEGIQAGRSDQWTRRLEELRSALVRHLLVRAGPARLEVLTERVHNFAEDTRRVVQHQVAAQSADLEQLDALESLVKKRKEAYLAAQQEIQRASNAIRDSKATADLLYTAFRGALPGLLDRAWADEASWTSDKNPLTSPRKHAKQVAGKAKDSVLAAIERWMHEAGSIIVTEGLNTNYSKAEELTAGMREYLREATGRDGDELDTEIRTQTLAGAFPELTPTADPAALVGTTLLHAALSAAIGYIIADIILFYMLGLISGFLNPWLLAAAVVGAVGAYLLKGREWVRAWIRKQIFSKIRGALTKDEHGKKIRKQMADAVEGVFKRLAKGFEESAARVLDEVRYQQRKTEEDLAARRKVLGTPEELRAEVTRLRARAADIEATLDHVLAALQAKGSLVEVPS